MALDIAETPPQPFRRELSFYLVFCIIVLPLWSAIPLSWAFTIFSLYSGRIWHFSWPGRSLFLVTLLEVFFSIYHYHLARSISGPPPFGPGKLLEIQAAYARLLKAGLANLPEDGRDEESMDGQRPGSPAETIIQLDHDDPRAVDFRNSLRTWFCRIPWSSIKTREIRQWLYWSIFNAELPMPDKLSNTHSMILDDALDHLQKRAGCRIPEGSDPTIKPIRLTIDDVNVWSRPFMYYAIIAFINWYLRNWYARVCKTRHGSYEGLEYLLRVPKQWVPATGPRPIVFVHGLGLGLLQYNMLITHLLTKFSDRPMLVLLQPQISQDIFHPNFLRPMSRRQTSDRLAALMDKLGWVHRDIDGEISEDTEVEKESLDPITPRSRRGVTMLSHSNGSYTHAWMLKDYPAMITRSCFVDPVTFCSWEGDVCYNFLYRPCSTGIEVLMRYFVSTELGVANLLQRHFDWASNSLWYEEIPNARDPSKTFFLLGGSDKIVCAERVKRYLTSHGVRKGLWFDPKGRHGQALINGGPGHAEIIRWLQEF